MLKYRDFIRVGQVKKLFNAALVLLFTALIFMVSINIYVVSSTSGRIYDNVAAGEYYDCILVLGCSVRPYISSEGEKLSVPSHMLEDRLETAFNAYKNGAAPKILVSGDHGQVDYDEVNVMKSYLIDKGVPSEDIFMDHAGFSTYESIYRAKELFGVESLLIVTQKYHLYRALFIADTFGMEASGADAELRNYGSQFRRDVREVAARCKDFFNSIFKPEIALDGEKIDINGNGDVTNDKQLFCDKSHPLFLVKNINKNF